MKLRELLTWTERAKTLLSHCGDNDSQDVEAIADIQFLIKHTWEDDDMDPSAHAFYLPKRRIK